MNKAISAGGILIKRDNGELKIPMVVFERRDVAFPKGHVEFGETIEQAAVREFEEETGLSKVSIVEKLGVVTRSAQENSGEVVLKDIHLFLMMSIDLEQIKHDEQIEWLTIDQALHRMAFSEEALFLTKIRNKLEATL